MDFVRKLSGAGAGAAAIASMLPSPALAEPAIDHVLSNVTLEENDHCAVYNVAFNFPVRYINHFPNGRGDELRIGVRAVDGGDHNGAMSNREAVRVPQGHIAQVTGIDFEGDRPEGPSIVVLFDDPANFQVAQGSDFRSVRIAVSTTPNDASCAPASHPRGAPANEAPIETVPTAPPAETPAAAPTLDGLGAADPALLEVRNAITAGDNAHAIQLLTRILTQANAPADAQEMLGLVRERNGQSAQARAEYEEYLRRFPNGPGAERVRQRLAVLMAASAPTPRPTLRAVDRERRGGGAEWTASASWSQYYMRDDNTHTFQDNFAPTLPSTTETQTTQNEVLSALDADVAITTNHYHARLRTSAAYTNDFRTDGKDEGSVSSAYLEVGDAEDHVVARVGRQTRSTGGVLGRFDGALVSLRPLHQIQIDIATGYPVETSRDLTLDPHRYFYNASVEFQGDKWNATLYALQQKNRGLVDRESVGIETRYVGDHANMFMMVDYDTHYQQVNIGLLNGTFNLAGDNTLGFSIDHRKAPMLTTTNALIGQTVSTMNDLLSLYTQAEIEQLALDRTSESNAYALSFTHPFNDRFSVNIDATLANLSATPTSGGVPATEATGDEIYASAQLVGTSLFKEGDLGIVGIRYADTATSERYGFDINTRYPINRMVRINPRLRVNYRQNKNDDGDQLAVRPSMRMNIYANRRFSLELEGGAEWQRTQAASTTDESWDYYVNVGYRFDF